MYTKNTKEAKRTKVFPSNSSASIASVVDAGLRCIGHLDQVCLSPFTSLPGARNWSFAASPCNAQVVLPFVYEGMTLRPGIVLTCL